MFIASKYEEIDPFFMRTIVARIGKYRFTQEAILAVERHILLTLEFKLASLPTILEFLERYLSHDYFKNYPIGAKKLALVSKYLACLQAHEIYFVGQKASLVAINCVALADKICKRDEELKILIKRANKVVSLNDIE